MKHSDNELVPEVHEEAKELMNFYEFIAAFAALLEAGLCAQH